MKKNRILLNILILLIFCKLICSINKWNKNSIIIDDKTILKNFEEEEKNKDDIFEKYEEYIKNITDYNNELRDELQKNITEYQQKLDDLDNEVSRSIFIIIFLSILAFLLLIILIIYSSIKCFILCTKQLNGEYRKLVQRQLETVD